MKQIRVENFRCYDNLTVNLKPGVNLLIGDNASGKTTVLKACRYVLSFRKPFRKFSGKALTGPPDEHKSD